MKYAFRTEPFGDAQECLVEVQCLEFPCYGNKTLTRSLQRARQCVDSIMNQKPRIHYTKPSITELEVRYATDDDARDGQRPYKHPA